MATQMKCAACRITMFLQDGAPPRCPKCGGALMPAGMAMPGAAPVSPSRGPAAPPAYRSVVDRVPSWLVGLAAFIMVVAAFAQAMANRGRGGPYFVGQIVGGVLGLSVLAGIVALIAWLVSGRDKRRAGIAFCIAAIVVGGLSTLGNAGRRAADRRANEDLVDNMRAIVESSNDPSAPVATRAKVDPSHSAERQLLTLMNNLLVSVQNEGLAYQKDIAQLDLMGALDPYRLDTTEELADSRDRLQRMGVRLDAYEKKVLEIMTRFPAEVRILNIPENLKEQAITSFTAGQAGGLAQFKSMIKSERDVMSAIDEILAFAEQRVGRITVDQGELMFEDPADAEEYQALVGNLQALAGQQQTQIQSAQQQSVRSMQQLDQAIGSGRP